MSRKKHEQGDANPGGATAVDPSALPGLELPDPYLPGHGDAGYAVEKYELALDYRVSTNRLAGAAKIFAVAAADITRVTLDLARNLQVAKVLVGGRRPARYAHTGDRLHITLAEEVPAEQGLEILVTWAGSPRPHRGPWGSVGWEELTDGVLVAGQPDGAMTWFPCNDHPGQKAAFDFIVTCDSPFTVVANGRLVSRTAKGGSRTEWVYEQAQPISSYLATLQIGLYDTWRLTGDATAVPMLVAAPRALARPVAADLARQGEMMAAFQRWFGPYPYDRYTVVVTGDDLEIPLESAGASVFGRNHLAGQGGYERLVAHELAHTWFGNCLSLGGWRNIWLNEGFAAYSEWIWSEESGGASADTIAARTHAELARLPEDLTIGDPGPDDMFDDRVYQRGALTVHALRRAMGDAAFRTMLAAWVAENRHGVVDIPAFTRHAARFTSADVSGLLQRWLYRPELPRWP